MTTKKITIVTENCIYRIIGICYITSIVESPLFRIHPFLRMQMLNNKFNKNLKLYYAFTVTKIIENQTQSINSICTWCHENTCSYLFHHQTIIDKNKFYHWQREFTWIRPTERPKKRWTRPIHSASRWAK